MSAHFIYDNKNNLSIGSVTKTKNGIVVKSHYPSNIKDYCLKWEDVNFVNDHKEMEAPSYIFFSLPKTHKHRKIIEQYPGCSVLFKEESCTVVGKDMELNLKVCLFHGLTNIIVPEYIENKMTVHQKKLFKKICVKI